MKKSILAMLGLLTFFAGLAQAEPAPPKVRTYYIAADEVEWDYAPGGVNKMMGMKFEGILESLHRARTAPHRHGLSQGALPRIHRRNLHPAQAASRLNGSTPAFSVPSCALRSATRYAWYSRTTPPALTACILTACSTTRIPKAHDTRTEPPAPTRMTTRSRPARPMSTSGRFRNVPGPGPTIPVRSCGSITRTPTN